MEYYIIIFFLFLFAFLEQFIKPINSKFLFIVAIFFLVLFAGTRYDFGRDYFVYKTAFYNLTYENYATYLFEPLFTVLCVILRPLGFNFFIFFMAFTTIIYKSNYIRKYSYYPLFSLLVYFSISIVLYEMGQMRQALAMILTLSAFSDCFNNSKKSFFFKIGIAILLHYSAFIVLPCFFLTKLNLSTRKIVIILLLLLPFTYINISSIFLYFASIISIEHIAVKILDYSSRDMSLGLNLSLLLRVFVLLGLLFFREQLRRIVSYGDQLIILYFYGVCLYIIFNSSPEIGMRSAAYFKILEILIFPLFIAFCKGIYNRLVIICLISLYLIWTVSRLFLSHPDAFLPYKSFLF